VIRGPGAFVEIANGFDDYEAAMRRKLIRELSAQVIGRTAPWPDRPSPSQTSAIGRQHPQDD
ncbi:DUF1194 domain-containing protein, partial [Yoonia sp.]|uniref:DUF1194 domain-containing protein n=1 Tax=Yoonia sp. TaxID=2212373 RepID=UPI0019FF890A